MKVSATPHFREALLRSTPDVDSRLQATVFLLPQGAISGALESSIAVTGAITHAYTTLMGPIRAILVMLPLLMVAKPANAVDLDAYAAVLDRYTHEVNAVTFIDYKRLQKAADWDQVVMSLERSRPEQLSTRDEELAFWINAYNILAIDLVRRNYPVDSIRDIGSLLRPVWDREAGTIDGRAYSLGQIDHDILRPKKDPRIHAAIVCASRSCPSLRSEPYNVSQLDAQLDQAVRIFLSNSWKGLRVERDQHTIRLSRIFDWFAEDFRIQGEVLNFVARYAPVEARDWLVQHSRRVRIEYFDYDWRLNDLS